MEKNEDSDSPGWRASLFMQTTNALFAAASAATTRSSQSSGVFSSRDDNGVSQLQKLQREVTRVLKGFSPSPEVKGSYNPEVLTSLKRQWARFQLQSLEQRHMKEPSKLFESMVIVGLHPSTNSSLLEKLLLEKAIEEPKKVRSLLNNHHQVHAEPNLEPKVLFVYPPGKQLPIKSKDLLSFCFPAGVEARAVEKTPSLSELNEILLGQEQFKQKSQPFVFRLQVADDSVLYGCCILVEEMLQKPSKLVSMFIEEKPFASRLSRHIITTPRCYCILSRLPFFDLHFGVLRSIFIEERFERLTKGIDMINLLSHETDVEENISDNNADTLPTSYSSGSPMNPTEHSDHPQLIKENYGAEELRQTDMSLEANKITGYSNDAPEDFVDGFIRSVSNDNNNTDDVLPLLLCHLHEEFDSPVRNFRSQQNEVEDAEPSSSGQEDDTCTDDNILQWAKENSHGSLQIICEYYDLKCPARGSRLTFQPLEHLHPLEFQRPESVLDIAGSTVDLRTSCNSLGFPEAQSALFAEDEATSLSIWTVATLCGCLRLENVMTMLAAALLEKQIVVTCSNLGVLSASVLSIIPLIRPYQWQSLLMPILPNDMLEFLDAPVPYIVGIKNKNLDIQSRVANAILVDANKNQVRSPSMPKLPQHKELFSNLSPYHAKLVGESYLAKRRPIYECTDVQIEAAKDFLAVLRSYLDSFCSNLRSHTITNVQSNNDKVSLLLRDSFIDSFSYYDRPFMKLFVDTQLFSVHTDRVLSFYQKD